VPVLLRGVRLSLHPAGHVLGSAQVRLEHAGSVWVVSGDYKRQADPTCAPFEPLACDVFVSEATFAQPQYSWPPVSEVVAEIWSWWQANRARGIASVLFCYALGKAQRVLAELTAFTAETVYVHPAIAPLTRLYRKAGIAMLPTLTSAASADYRGSLVLVPPGAGGTPWMRRLGEHSRALCSGWMCAPQEARRRAYDRGFVLSDHADWPALTSTCLASGARRVLLMHGESAALAAYLRQRGVDAASLT
jgi:putative mRNA 3-end processing factor